jgi:hypothetical protein
MAEQAPPAPTVVGGSRELECQERRFTGEPLSMELKDADIKDVLRTFAKITGLNIVVDPDVTGSVTVQLENVPWDQALDISCASTTWLSWRTTCCVSRSSCGPERRQNTSRGRVKPMHGGGSLSLTAGAVRS